MVSLPGELPGLATAPLTTAPSIVPLPESVPPEKVNGLILERIVSHTRSKWRARTRFLPGQVGREGCCHLLPNLCDPTAIVEM